MATWISDLNGNKCSVEYFGTSEAAQAALDSLKNCKNCINCTDCSGCSCCSYCSVCSGCTDCSRCTDCSDCSCCTDCSGCSRCTDCSDCSCCTDCSEKRGISENKGAFKMPEIPVLEGIHSKVYQAASKENALDMGSWHYNGFCGTTHCRAGWVTHLCGDQGKALEDHWGTNHAAWLIYRKSDPSIAGKRPNFFATNEDALADMKRLAEAEAA